MGVKENLVSFFKLLFLYLFLHSHRLNLKSQLLSLHEPLPDSHCLCHLQWSKCSPSFPPAHIVSCFLLVFVFLLVFCVFVANSSPEMCICITCQSYGSKPRCYLIDVWICLTKRDHLSHGSVRQNMCEQKLGHLGRIRNCEDKEGKNNVIIYRVLVCMCSWEYIWVGDAGYIRHNLSYILCAHFSVSLHGFLYGKLEAKGRLWLCNVSPPGQVVSNKKQTSTKAVVWQGSYAGLTRSDGTVAFSTFKSNWGDTRVISLQRPGMC